MHICTYAHTTRTTKGKKVQAGDPGVPEQPTSGCWPPAPVSPAPLSVQPPCSQVPGGFRSSAALHGSLSNRPLPSQASLLRLGRFGYLPASNPLLAPSCHLPASAPGSALPLHMLITLYTLTSPSRLLAVREHTETGPAAGPFLQSLTPRPPTLKWLPGLPSAPHGVTIHTALCSLEISDFLSVCPAG